MSHCRSLPINLTAASANIAAGETGWNIPVPLVELDNCSSQGEHGSENNRYLDQCFISNCSPNFDLTKTTVNSIPLAS